MKVILFKSVSVGDILHALTIGMWQFGSNGKWGPVGYKTPPGSAVLIKCMENDYWYPLGLTKGNPETIPQDTADINWPSFEDMGKPKDYVAQVKFCSRVGPVKRYEEDICVWNITERDIS